MTIMFIVLCGFSFYLGRIFCSEKDRFEAADVTKAVESSRETVVSPLQTKSIAFPECSIDYQDYTPCTDPKVLLAINFMILRFLGPSIWLDGISIYTCIMTHFSDTEMEEV